jgi:hypothetical protein
MNKLRGIYRALLFVLFSDRVIKHYYKNPVEVGWYAWIEIEGRTIGFEDFEGAYHFSW